MTGSAGLSEQGIFTAYTAKSMAPVRLASHCSCGKPKCVFRPGYLAPFRDHIARLHHVLAYAHTPGQLGNCRDQSWSGVNYHLQMAASIEDVEADTGYVDLRGSSAYCEPVADYDAEHSRLASQYASALIIFNFVWAAYEGAIKVGAPDFLPKEHTAFRGRELMALHEATASSLSAFEDITRNAHRRLLHVGDLEGDRAKIDRYPPGSAAQAAELVRLFRNHLAHGSDAPPAPDQDHALCRTIRFYKLARLLLLLIQVIAIQALDPPDALYVDDWNDDEPGRTARTTRDMLVNLHLDDWLV
jgi:hypothetical protein